MTKQAPPPDDTTVRVSVSFRGEEYADLKRTADAKRVSVAWVVRDAVHEYLRSQAPLFRT